MDVDFRTYLVNLSGRGDKDLDFVIQNYGYGEKYKDFRF